MGKIAEFPADRLKKGVHAYTPEMGERKVNTHIDASLSHYGNHYSRQRSRSCTLAGIWREKDRVDSIVIIEDLHNPEATIEDYR
ncbi:MAG: hypothetical protein ACQEXV_22190 [Bacillota bacterium]